MNTERFIFGDPRFLSNGAKRKLSINYDYEPETMDAGEKNLVTTESTAKVMADTGDSLYDAIIDQGQVLHRGKGGYHSRPELNLFLVKGMEPTVGVEIETVARCDTDDGALCEDLRSNWFHFERDGSLPDRGFELITEPLPPFVYRDPHTWTGLQNTLTPWLESFTHPECGLHVHVGLRQFEDIDGIPFPNKADRRRVGKYMTLCLNFAVLGRTFVDRVVLRKNSAYCASTKHSMFEEISNAVHNGGVTAREFMDYAIRMSVGNNVMSGNLQCMGGYTDMTRLIRDFGSGFQRYSNELGICTQHSGEGSEMNARHPYTVEFRRPKGTLHSLSIHRIVEFATLVVRYAGSLARTPVRNGKDVIVTPDAMYDYIAANTNNAALKELAEKARD